MDRLQRRMDAVLPAYTSPIFFVSKVRTDPIPIPTKSFAPTSVHPNNGIIAKEDGYNLGVLFRIGRIASKISMVTPR